MEITIYTDGAARGNPGLSASGYMIMKENKAEIKTVFSNGAKTNNYAEYAAVIAALKKVVSVYGNEIEITLYSDSQLVVNQLNNKFKVKDKYIEKQ